MSSERLSILVLASTFPVDQDDNVPRFILDLCARLARTHTVNLLTQHRPGARTREAAAGIEVHRFRYAPERFERLGEHGGITVTLNKAPVLWLLVPFFFLFQIIHTIRLVRSLKPDIVHAHWIFPQGLSAAIALLFCRQRPRLICTSHGADIFAFDSGLLKRLKSWVAKRSEAITVVSHAILEHVVDNAIAEPEKLHVIPMGTDTEDTFVPGDIHRKTGQLLFVGRLVEKKGLRYLLEAIHRIAKDLPDLRLLIAGDGPEMETLTRLSADLKIRDRVRFLGQVHQSDLPRLYQESEMAIFPFIRSEYGDMEGLGLVVVEAMASCCPVIAGDVPAVYDLVDPGVNGLIVQPTEVDSLVDSVRFLHADPAERRRMAEAARRFVSSRFSWASVIRSFNGLFADVVKTD